MSRTILRVFVCALALLAACDGESGIAAPKANVNADEGQRTYGLNLKLSDGGVLKADLKGDTAFQRPNTQIFDLKGVRLTFYDKQGKNPGTLTSKTGEYDEATAVMVARGNVVLITKNDEGRQRTVRSEELHYDQRGDRVWSTRETTIVEEGRTMVTQGFESDTRFTNMKGNRAKAEGVQVNAGAGDF
jgi:LPS export ABC transporter protein LptC